MTAQPVRHVLIPNTREKAHEAVLSSFGFLHYVDTGECLLLHDGERRMEINIILSESDGSIAGSPERVEFRFVGYTEEEADVLVAQYLQSTLRGIDGAPANRREDTPNSHSHDQFARR